jgi:hypothetical protein
MISGSDYDDCTFRALLRRGNMLWFGNIAVEVLLLECINLSRSKRIDPGLPQPQLALHQRLNLRLGDST